VSRRVVEIFIDDLDGKETGPGGSTVPFAIDGVAYTIDLNARNAKVLRDALAPYMSAGVRLGVNKNVGRQQPSTRGAQAAAITARKKERADVVEWLRQERGITAADRGRLKQEYYEEYKEWQRSRAQASLAGAAKPAGKPAVAAQRRPLASVPPATFAQPVPARRRRSASA